MPGCCDPIEMRVFHSVTQIDHTAWESLRNPSQLFTDLNYLQAVESSQAIDCEFLYFLFYKDKALYLGLWGYALEIDILSFTPKMITNLFKVVRKMWLKSFIIKTLIIGTPISLGETFVLAPDVRVEDLETAINQLQQYAQEKKIKLILGRDFKQERNKLEESLEKNGFRMIHNYPLAYLPIQWKSFDEYLAAMTSHYRRQFRLRVRRKVKQEIHTKIISDQEILAYTPCLEKLFRNVQQRSNEFPHELIGENYHKSMRQHLNGNSYWQLYFQKENLVGFLHFIIYKKKIIGQYIGLDYQVANAAQLYFNAIYDQIRFAIENDIEMIEAGVTTYPAKTSMGFSLTPQRMYLWHKSSFFRQLARWFSPNPANFELDDCHLIFRESRFQNIYADNSISHF